MYRETSSSLRQTASRSRRHRHRAAGVLAILGASCFAITAQAQLNLTGTSYTQNFDSLGSGLPAGWTVRLGATATALGNTAALITTPTDWGSTTGAFYNYAAADAVGISSGSAPADQAAATDRALGIRQTGGTSDTATVLPAFTFQIANTVDLSNFNLTFSAQMLSVQPRSTTWTIQYGLGNTPTFSTLGTYTDPGVFGSTTETFDSTALGALANQNSNVWIRIVALSTTTGSGNRDSFGIDDFSLTYTRAAITPDYWDANGSAAGSGGTGIWSTVAALFAPDTTGTSATAAYDPNHMAVFGGTAGTVTVSGTVTTNRGLQFDSNGYVLNGGTIALAGIIPTITVTNAGQTATVNSVIDGTVGLAKNGAGTLVLGGSNTYSGGTSINQGVVSISSDANLGAASSGVTFAGGTLQTTANLTLAATRALTGSGTIDVAPGTTLGIAGSVAGLDLTLSNTGSVQFTGTPVLAGLTLQKVTSIALPSPTSTLGIVGNFTTHFATGTQTLPYNVDFGSVASAIRTINVDSASASVVISGNLSISGTGARISKTGAGTLELDGTANNLTGGLRLGEAGLPAVEGGTLRVASATAFGGGAFQANAGNLVLLNDMTGANSPAAAVGLSIGSSDVSPVTISGSDIEFKGASSLFIGGTTSYQNKLILNNNVTLTGALGATASAVASSGLTIAGPGSLTIASATNAINRPITVDQATLIVTGSFTATSGIPSTTLQNGAKLRGTGIMGAISGNATSTIAPGTVAQPTGVLTGTDVTLSGAALSLDIRSKDTTAGILQYDQISATSSFTLNSGTLTGVIDAGAQISIGDLFFIIIDGSSNNPFGTFDGLADNLATPAQTTFTGPGGTVTFQISYHGDSGTGVFDASALGGNDIVLRALVAVPEPGSLSFVLCGAVGMLGLSRKRRAQNLS